MRRAAILMMFLSSCASTPSPPTMSVQSNPQEIARLNHAGQNVVRGRALLSRESFARTCAGSDVNLIPDSAYARQLMTRMFGGLNGGLLTTIETGVARPDERTRYAVAIKTTRCDGQGYFTFKDVPDGAYYVIANVIWPTAGHVPANWRADDLMRRVEVAGGQSREILLWSDTNGRMPQPGKHVVEIL